MDDLEHATFLFALVKWRKRKRAKKKRVLMNNCLVGVAFTKGLLALCVSSCVVCGSVAANGEALAIKYSLPQFGHYVSPYGVIRENLPDDKWEASSYRLRAVEELIQEWFSSCLDKSGVDVVTKDAVDAWLTANYIPVEPKLQSVSEAQEIERVASVVAYLACEYQVYGLDAKKFKTCIGHVNKLSKDSWSLRIFGGKLTIDTYRAKARKNYNTGMDKVYAEMRRLIQPLESIHRKEHERWIASHQVQYAQLKKADDDLEHNLLMKAEIAEAVRAANAAAARARAAEAAARAAERRAADAEHAARCW